MAKSLNPECEAFQTAIEVLGRPWTALILGLLQAGPLRFSELGDRACGVGDKILSTRLKELESRGIVVRRVEHGPPVRVQYQLTPKGEAFEQVAEAIERWGRELIADEEKPRRRPA
jgi:DNA-binding HxlR family transcriptional regulator